MAHLSFSGPCFLAETRAPSGAPSWRFPCGAGPRFASMRLDLRMASAGSRQEAVVPPGGAPAPPECRLAKPARGRRTGHARELPAHAQGRHRRISGNALPFVPHSRRLMRAPLGGRGDWGYSLR